MLPYATLVHAHRLKMVVPPKRQPLAQPTKAAGAGVDVAVGNGECQQLTHSVLQCDGMPIGVACAGVFVATVWAVELRGDAVAVLLASLGKNESRQ